MWGRVSSGFHGPWRSLVARLTGGQEVVGSNPAGPTRKPAPLSGFPLSEATRRHSEFAL